MSLRVNLEKKPSGHYLKVLFCFVPSESHLFPAFSRKIACSLLIVHSGVRGRKKD